MNTRIHFVIPYTSVILLFLSSLLCFSQDILKADSLLNIVHIGELSKKEKAISLASIASYHPDPGIALQYAKKSLQIAIAIDDRILQAEAWEEISHVERRLGNNTLSLQASLKALQIYEALELIERQGASYGQLASNAVSDEDFQQAILYLKKARAIYSKGSSLQKNQLITILNLGEVYRLTGHLDSAITCFNNVLHDNKRLDDKTIEGYSLGNLGMVYAAQNKLGLAKEKIHEAMTILSKMEDVYATSTYLAELGMVHQKEKNLKEAEDYYLKAIIMAKDAGLKEQIRDFSRMLSNFYKMTESYQQALVYQELYQVYQDSLVNKKTIQKIEQIKASYKINKREIEIESLSLVNTKQRQLVILLIIITLLVLLFIYLFYRVNRKINRTNQVLSNQKIIISQREQEKTWLLKELNHRVKNNLQMITSLLNIQSQTLTGHPAQEAIIAGKYRVEALSLVHRKLYQEGVDTRILIKDYIEELVLGLFQGYGASFKPLFNIENISIPIDTAIPLALIINELITNSLKYAYSDVADPILKISVVQKTKHQLSLQIIDNGIGFTLNEPKTGNSFGIKLIQSLIEQLEGTIEKINQQGTHWVMLIKIV